MSNNFDGPVILDDVTDYFGFGRAAGTAVSTGPRIYSRTATPNGALTAPAGSIALANVGGVAHLYINTDGAQTWADTTIP